MRGVAVLCEFPGANWFNVQRFRAFLARSGTVCKQWGTKTNFGLRAGTAGARAMVTEISYAM